MDGEQEGEGDENEDDGGGGGGGGRVCKSKTMSKESRPQRECRRRLGGKMGVRGESRDCLRKIRYRQID